MMDFALPALTTMIVVVDPVGLIPIFLSLTSGMTLRQRIQTAAWATAMAAFILVGSAVFGEKLLQSLGISLSAFRIAGGLMLFYTAFEMVFRDRQVRRSEASEVKVDSGQVRQTAAFPLAVPLMAGPGAITACILLAAETNDQLLQMAVLVAVILVTCLLTLLSFLAAQPLNAVIGETGKILLTRLLGVILAALAVQFVVDGATEIINANSAKL